MQNALDSGREHDCVFVRDNKNGVIATPVVEGVIEGINARKIDALIIDPIVAFHRVPENDNGKMDAVMQEFKDIADWTTSAVEIVGHTRKTDGEEVKIDDVRAASAIVNAVRNLRLLNGMTYQESAEFNIGELERRSYYRFDEGKPNLKRPGGFSTWMKMESVCLSSGEEVGVPERWTAPRNDERAGDPITAMATAPLAPLTEDDLAVLSLITDRIMKCKPVMYGAHSPDSPPKLFSMGVQGGKQKKARTAAVYKSVEQLIAHSKLRIDDQGRYGRPLKLGPMGGRVFVVDNQSPRERPWPPRNPARKPTGEAGVEV
jgi:hypothetical protein